MHERTTSWLILAAWAAALAVGLALAPRLPRVAVTDPFAFFPRDAPSRVATRALARRFPGAQAASQVVIVLETDRPGGIAKAGDAIASLAQRLREALPSDAVSGIVAPGDDPVVADRLISSDGRSALIVVRVVSGFASEEAGQVVRQVEALLPEAIPSDSGVRASVSGDATLGRDYLDAIQEGAHHSALATVLLVAATLLLVYRSPMAVLLSLVTLGVCLGVASGAVTLAAMLGLPVAFQTRGFLVALVFGVGTDYCLLLFARLREELQPSQTIGRDALAAAVTTARRRCLAVIGTSAVAVVVACALMGLARFGLFADSGPALALGVAVTGLAVLTLAPVLFRLAGAALFWPAASRRPPSGRLWRAIARGVVARPLAFAAFSLMLLAPYALEGLRVHPSFELELDIPKRSPSEAGYAALRRHFDPAQVSTLTLLLDSPEAAPELRGTAALDGLYQLTRLLAADPGVVRVWSATRPTGKPGLLDRATLRSQLAALEAGLANARGGANQLAAGLDRAREEVTQGREDLAAKRQALADEQKHSLLGAFAPGRFESARSDLAEFDQKLAELQAGLRRGAAGAEALAKGVERGRARLSEVTGAPGAPGLLDHLALTPGDVAASPDLQRALAYYLSPDARAARFDVELAQPPNSGASVATAERLRSLTAAWLPALGLNGGQVLLAGPTAITADLARLTRADMRRLDLWIVGGVFVLLVGLLGELAAPAAITALILVSYEVALGALHLMVRAGVWAGLDWKAPFFLFVLLVAIGADYGVFLLGRAREEARRLPYHEAVARALEATGPVVTSCGLVLAGTFATLLLSRIAFLEQVGFGITVGVLVDTGIVRPFLLPALALLLGRRSTDPRRREAAA